MHTERAIKEQNHLSKQGANCIGVLSPAVPATSRPSQDKNPDTFLSGKETMGSLEAGLGHETTGLPWCAGVWPGGWGVGVNMVLTTREV